MITIKLFHLVVMIVGFCSKVTFVNCYSKVFRAGANTNDDLQFSDGPTIHRASNTDIVFPEVFNISEATANSEKISGKPEGFTGRASSYHRPLQFSVFTPTPRRPSGSVQPNFENKDFYPIYRPRPPNKSELDKLKGKGEAQDRYTPGEAVATSLYKQNGNKKGYVYSFPKQPVTGPTSDTIFSQKDLFAFPPNLGSNYGPSSKPSEIEIEPSISSYLPPPAGPVNTFNGFVGPVSPEYLPNHLKNPPVDDIGSKMNSKPTSSMDDSNTALKDDVDHDDNPTPPPDFMHDHNHDSLNSDQVKELMAEQMPMMNPPEPQSDHSYDDHSNNQEDHGPHPQYGQHAPWDSLPNYFSGHSLDSFPEIIYDDLHHHHHNIPAPQAVVTTTTTERPEPRVKKYSYFYLSRKLWYIPLYFTVWFSFYILFLILKSIARHKVNLPNHYQRGVMKRSLVDDIGHKPTTEEVNRLTEYTMSKIDDFKQIYL